MCRWEAVEGAAAEQHSDQETETEGEGQRGPH